MFNYHPPSHLQDLGWQETPEKPAGLRDGGGGGACTQKYTYPQTCTRFHFIPSWVMGSLTICLILSTNKTRAGGLLRQCNPSLKWVEQTELHTHVGSQVYTCPNVHSQKRKCLPIESLNKSNSCILKKTLSSNGFIRATKSLTKLSFFHPFPIFLLAFGLHPGGSRFGKLYLLWNHTLSFSRHGRAPEACTTWSAVSPPNPPLVVVTNTVQHWFVHRRHSHSSNCFERHHNLEIKIE